MNQEVKTKWLEALRSGQYQQGKYELKIDDKFCCLGVLCDIHAKETGNQWENGSYLGTSILLPTDVVKWAELNHRSPAVNGIDLERLNDEQNYTFEQIANEIEKYL